MFLLDQYWQHEVEAARATKIKQKKLKNKGKKLEKQIP